MIECLKDKQGDVRLSAAIGLGTLGEEAKLAIPELQAAERDRDARVRRAAGVALSRIDPNLAPQVDPSHRRRKMTEARRSGTTRKFVARPGRKYANTALILD